MLKFPIYLDHNATTPCDPRVVEAMIPYFTNSFGNAASRNHPFGWQAEEAVDEARKQVADLIGANAKEIVFTSGATESDNLAIKGAAEMYREKGNHIITCVTEHKAVIDACKRLEKEGYRVTYLPVQKDGLISLDDLRNAITDKTILISIMTANNEIGTIQPVSELTAITHERGALFHTDAIQAFGKIPLNVESIQADLISFSAHKIYGPKGAGALFCAPSADLEPLLRGGSHEQGLRAGTENVPAIHGFGCAAEILDREGLPDLLPLRSKLEAGLASEPVEILCRNAPRLPNTINFYFPEWPGESVVMALDLEGFAVSNGSACSSGIIEPSHVIRALGYNDEIARSVVRVSFGKFTQAAEMDSFLEFVHRLAQRVGRTMP